MGKQIIDFLMSFRAFEELSFVFVPPGVVFLRSITRAIMKTTIKNASFHNNNNTFREGGLGQRTVEL